MTIAKTLLTGCALVVAASHAGCGTPCQAIETVADGSHGSFAFTTTSSAAVGASSNRGGLSTLDLEVSGAGASSVEVTGSFVDSLGNGHSFTLYLAGIQVDATVELGPGSLLCLDGAVPEVVDGGYADPDEGSACPRLHGNVAATSFTTDCQSGGGCALAINAGVKASATLPGGMGTFRVTLDLEHEDVRRNIACPVQASSWTEGTPGS